MRKQQFWKHELNLNIKRIDNLLDELTKYRSAVSADDVYIGHLDLSRFVWNTGFKMLSSGLIYRYLRDDEDIDKLLVMFSKLSCTMSKYVNDVVIKKNKERNEIDRLTNACDTFREKFVIWTLFDTGLRVSGFGDLKTRLSSCLKTHFLRQLY